MVLDLIDSYSFGEIIIDGEEYSNDVKIFPEKVKGNWWRKESHSLHPEDIEDVIEESPEILIVGTGSYGRVSIPDKTRDFLESKGIDLVDKETDEACEAYNELKNEKKVVAALHLTC